MTRIKLIEKEEALKENWEKTKVLLMGGELPRELKESIAVVVSAANSCKYCVAAHSMALQMMGFSQERIDDLTKNIESTQITPRDKKILEYARKATLTPHKITDTETDEIKSLGVTESQIVEVLGVMELFTGYNKFLDSLAVPLT